MWTLKVSLWCTSSRLKKFMKQTRSPYSLHLLVATTNILILRVGYRLPYVGNSNNFSVFLYHSSTLYLTQGFCQMKAAWAKCTASKHARISHFSNMEVMLNLHSNFQDSNKTHQTYTTKMLYYSNNFNKMAIRDGTWLSIHYTILHQISWQLVHV